MQFSQVIGQNQYKQDLQELVQQNRISHALLFAAPEGAGALPLAIAFAQYINCENKTETDSCGVCASCVKYAKLQHPDLHFAFPVTTTSSVKSNPVSDNFIAQWREAVLKQPYLNVDMWLETISDDNKQGSIQKEESKEILRKLQLKTYEAEYKVMIIWMAEKMNETCANKLLKILEEPPAKTLFLLISEHPEELMATIISRTQLIRIPKIDNQSMAEALHREFSVNEADMPTILHNAGGNYLKAVQLLTTDETNDNFYDYFTKLTRLAYTKNLPELTTLSDELATKLGREKQKAFLEYCLTMFRENFVLNYKKPEIVYLYKNEKEFSERFHPFINERNISALTKSINEAHYHIERNGSAKIIFFDLCLKLIVQLRK
ncbi:MAG: DNA polymerase III subunit delta' [Bacteroidales bacterium]|jgi:DNA polymerase-3 subunit delta'|nr:DNA polymerase III subunit delta' [Bacteroidales bacterium]